MLTISHDRMDAPGHSSPFPERVQQLTSQWLMRWSAAVDTPPDFLERFSSAQKTEKEKEIERIFARGPDSRESYEGRGEEGRAKTRARVRALIARSLARSEGNSVSEFFGECERTAGEFVKRARKFDASLPESDVHQALRNLWVFNSLQSYSANSVALSPSGFAYSLLYPYTDNWLDAAGRSSREKMAFLDRVSLRLDGVEPGRADEAMMILGRLIRMIEEEYPRPLFPDVHASLHAIHRAQIESLRLHDAPDHDYESELLPLTITKGGTSVLADGYLVTGDLSSSHTEAVFGYGVLLQLIDDLQDVDEDRQCGHSSPFSWAIRRGNLDSITNRLFHFMRGTVAIMNVRCGAGRPWLPPLIEQSCTALIMEAIARYQGFYSEEYLQMMEVHMPLHRSYFGAIRKKMKRRIAGAGQA